MTEPTGPRYTDEQRDTHLAAIAAAAADKPGHARYLATLAAHYQAGGTEDTEPTATGIDGITWKIECALSADVTALYSSAPAPGMHGGGYERQYLKARGAHRKTAALASATRRRNDEHAISLEGLLTLGTDPQ